ncbi:MAG: type III-A CRISPR-associated RAMP protein Csm4 [Flavobacteriaceae bacterium]|jgi:CRISPR-associated protein Csm4|nr:type III-A CRISPR-associated RAMP protein Csm4 [Flavobacteriaceae bacterium]
MPKFKIYKLHFTSPVHLGDTREDYGISLKTISSDTLYAALTSCLAKIGKQIPNNGDLGFTISSLFPFYQQDKESKAVYFLPKPLKSELPNLKDVENAKAIKKVQWIDIDDFSDFLNGKANIGDKSELIKGDYFVSKAHLIVGKDDKGKDVAFDNKFIDTKVSPRVTVSRTGQEDAIPFYMDRVYFKDHSGLFFLVEGDTKLLDIAIDILQYEGVGTDRNVGNGFFEYNKLSKSEIEINYPDDSEYVISLSMYIPENKQQLDGMLAGENVAYDFIRRGGWITTPPHISFRKNAIYAFTPGSIFSAEANQPFIQGKIHDLKPELDFDSRIEHPIWRNGKSIFIPIKL